MNQHYDVIIIGAGAGGGTLAYGLAPTGKRILLIERGTICREKENWDADEIFTQGRYQADEQWLDAKDQPFDPQAYYVVGGNTKLYGAALQRMRQEDFGELEHVDSICQRGRYPTMSLSPTILAPRACSKFTASAVKTRQSPRCRRSIPFPPSSMSPAFKPSPDSLRWGLTPLHLTLALDRNEANLANSPCIRCDTCDPYPCLLDAKMDAQTACVDPAIAYDNVTLRLNALVIPAADHGGWSPGRSGGNSNGPGTRNPVGERGGGGLRCGQIRRRCCCALPASSTPMVWLTVRTRVAT